MMLRGHLSQQYHPLQEWDAHQLQMEIQQHGNKGAMLQDSFLISADIESWVPQHKSTVWRSNSGEFHVSHNIKKKNNL